MAIKLFGGRVTIGKSQSIGPGVAQGTDTYGFMQQKYGLNYTSRNRLKAYRNIVYDCLSLIGEACGDYQPNISRMNDDQVEKLVDHPFLKLLKRPGGADLTEQSFSKFDLFEATAIYLGLQGDAYWYMELGSRSGQPKSITLLRPDKVGTDVNPDTGEINGYFIRRDGKTPIPLEVNEVLRFGSFNPEDPFVGKGTVEASSDYIITDESTAQFTKNFFTNNAGISGVLNIKGEVSKNAFRKFVRGFRQKYEGPGNAGKTVVVRDSEANFTKVGLGLDELNMPELRTMTLDDVLMAFKVPLPLLGKAEQTGLGRANVEALEYIFAKYNIDKKFQRFDAVLDFALERYYGEADLIFGHENIIPEDKEFKLNERDKSVDRWMTRNEIRDQDAFDSVDGGDQLFVPMANIPIDSDLVAAEPTPPTPAPADPAEEDTEDNLDNEGKGIKLIRRRILKKKELSSIQKEAFRLRLQRNQIGYERHYNKALDPIFTKQRKEALNNLEAHGTSLNKDFGSKLFDDAAYDSLMVQTLTPVLMDLSKQQGALAMIFAGDTENQFKLTTDIITFIRSSTLKMATNFNDQTLEALNTTLAEGIQEGEALSELKKRVEGVYDGIESYRAARISRTETLKASNNATEFAYKQTGYVTGKEWYVNPDACPICEPFDGKIVGLGETFAKQGTSVDYTDSRGETQTYNVDYDDVDNPPLHPNCRCTIVPIS